MREDDLFQDEDASETTPGQDNPAATYAELEQRCKAADLSLEESENFFDDEKAFLLSVPAGRHHRRLYFSGLSRIKRLLNTSFEQYIFLSDYSAICSYTGLEIEASIQSLGNRNPNSLLRVLFPDAFEEYQFVESKITPIVLSSETDAMPTITIGPASEMLQVLTSTRPSRRLSLKLSGVHVTRHDDAVTILEKISNSLFFQIDLLAGFPLGLERDRSKSLRPIRRQTDALRDSLRYPIQDYDNAPISLYWYAKSASALPLLQFLAFYQCIEFYFPTYYASEARRKIRTLLKDPRFRSDREIDLGRILAAINTSRSGGVGDERSQLRATLLECVDAGALREFVEGDENRKRVLSSKTKGLTEHRLTIANPVSDLRNDVADRIYDIRCRIVHTKRDVWGGEIELLLPFSKESKELGHDIDVLEFISQQVIIAASTRLEI